MMLEVVLDGLAKVNGRYVPAALYKLADHRIGKGVMPCGRMRHGRGIIKEDDLLIWDPVIVVAELVDQVNDLAWCFLQIGS